MTEEREELSLSKAAEFLLDECRMVLPGIQALLGFQLIVVFSPGFDEKLGAVGQWIHLSAIGLTALAVALIMTPAAYSRQTEPREVTEAFITICTRLLLLSMLPLALSICLDFYLIAALILSGRIAVWLATILFGVFVSLWLALPRIRVLRRAMGGRSG